MSSGPETIHRAITQWSPERAAALGLGALRRAALDDLIQGAHCSLNGTGDLRIEVELTEWGGMMSARASARCSDPLCADLLDTRRTSRPANDPAA